MRKRPPPLRFVCTSTSGSISCRAYEGETERVAGFIELEVLEGEKLADTVIVKAESALRRGIGTALFERAAVEACQRGLRLSSGAERTWASEGFWKKQVARGRAECLYTQRDKKRGAAQLDERLFPTGRRWRCRRYALKTCGESAKIDLSGTQRRIDWRSEPIVKRASKRGRKRRS